MAIITSGDGPASSSAFKLPSPPVRITHQFSWRLTKTIPTFILFELTILRRASATYSGRGMASCSDVVGREAFVQLSSRLYAWADLVECAILLQHAPYVFQASLQKTRYRKQSHNPLMTILCTMSWSAPYYTAVNRPRPQVLRTLVKPL